MTCGDCKGSGSYVGFRNKELCRECDGTGVVGGSELEIAQRKAFKKFGSEQIKQGLRPEYVCLNLTAAFGESPEEVTDKIKYIFLRKGCPSDKGRWVDWDSDRYPVTGVIEYFGRYPQRYYALYRRMEPGNNVFELVAFQ